MSVRLYVGNLPKELERQELAAVFEEYGDAVTTKVITDRKTGKCRGFGFVTVKNDEEADQIIEKFNGYVLKESPLKIEKANPRSKGDGENSEASGSGSTSSTSSKRKSKSSSKKPGGDNEAVQPDPRWAQELEKLKELLAAQTTNS